jgi:hypothetical protein
MKSFCTILLRFVKLLGMLIAAPLSVGSFSWMYLLPISLGNTVGSALFTGAYSRCVYFYRRDRGTATDWLVEEGESSQERTACRCLRGEWASQGGREAAGACYYDQKI